MSNDVVYKERPGIMDDNVAGFTETFKDDKVKFARLVKKTVTYHDQNASDYRDKCAWNEDYWRGHHWRQKRTKDENEPQPNVPVVHSTIENTVADSMDNYPDQIIRGVNGDDDLISVVLTESTRFTLQRARHQEAYERYVRSAHKVGTGVMQTFFNPDLAKGLGDVDYRYIPIKNFVWDTDARTVDEGYFCAVKDYISQHEFKALYPDIDLNKINAYDESEERFDDHDIEDVQGKQKEGVECITIYWKDYEYREAEYEDENGKTVKEKMPAKRTYISSAKVIGDNVVEDHIHQYEWDSYMFRVAPFVPLENQPVGLSFTDIYIDQADTINRIEQEFIKNLQASSVLRYMVNNAANLDESALMDFNKRIVRGDVIHEGALRAFPVPQFNGQALAYKQSIMGQMKEFSGQLDVNIGQSSAGVTAASAINSLQDYGAKKSRLFIRLCHREHKLQVRDTVFLMQEHYAGTERIVRISPEARALVDKALAEQAKVSEGQTPIVSVENNRYTVDFSQIDLDNFDVDYDINIIPQKKTPATSNLINSMAQQFANSGQMPGDLIMEMVEFEGKDVLLRKFKERMGIEKQFEQMQQQMEQLMQASQDIVKQNEQLMQEKEKLEEEVWKEKFDKLRIQVLQNNSANGPEEELEEIDQAEAEFIRAVRPQG